MIYVCVFHQVCVRVCSLMCVYVCSRVFVGRIGGSCLLIRVVKDGDCMVQSEGICVVNQLCDDNRKTHLFPFPVLNTDLMMGVW